MTNTPALSLEVLRHFDNEPIFHMVEAGVCIEAETVASERAQMTPYQWITGAQAAAFRARRGCAGVVVALCALGAQAQEFTTTEKALYIGMQTLTLSDWAQTRDIARNPDKFAEVNPILGKSPSVGRVNTFMASRLALQHVAAVSLPAAYRKPVMGALTAIYSGVVIHNDSVGVKGNDKAMHLIAGAAVGALTHVATDSKSAGCISGAVVGVGKELFDKSQGKRFNASDALVTLAGGCIGAQFAGWTFAPGRVTFSMDW